MILQSSLTPTVGGIFDTISNAGSQVIDAYKDYALRRLDLLNDQRENLIANPQPAQVAQPQPALSVGGVAVDTKTLLLLGGAVALAGLLYVTR